MTQVIGRVAVAQDNDGEGVPRPQFLIGDDFSRLIIFGEIFRPLVGLGAGRTLQGGHGSAGEALPGIGSGQQPFVSGRVTQIHSPALGEKSIAVGDIRVGVVYVRRSGSVAVPGHSRQGTELGAGVFQILYIAAAAAVLDLDNRERTVTQREDQVDVLTVFAVASFRRISQIAQSLPLEFTPAHAQRRVLTVETGQGAACTETRIAGTGDVVDVKSLAGGVVLEQIDIGLAAIYADDILSPFSQPPVSAVRRVAGSPGRLASTVNW